MADETENLGPFPCDLAQKSLVVRDDHCELYNSRCLKIACDKGWNSFTCTGCGKASSSARKIQLQLESTAQHEHVSLRVFLERVQNNSQRRGYTPANFLQKIRDEVKTYYGKDSAELKYVAVQLKMLTSVLNEEDIEVVDLRQLVEDSQKLIIGLRKPPSILDIYMKVCGSSWGN